MPQTAAISPFHTPTKRLSGSIPFLWSTELAPLPRPRLPAPDLGASSLGWPLVPGRYMLISRGWEAPLCLIAAGDWAVGDGGGPLGGHVSFALGVPIPARGDCG